MKDCACEKCDFWLPDAVSDKGECRRYPPILDRLGSGKWPLTPKDGFCGEWTDQKKK